MISEVHEFLVIFWGFQVWSVRDHEHYQEFTIGTRLAVARLRLIQRMSLENSFAVESSFAVRFTRTFNKGACSDLGTPRDHIAAPLGLYSQLEGRECWTSSYCASRTKQSTSRRSHEQDW